MRLAFLSTASLDVAGTLVALCHPSDGYGLGEGAAMIVLSAVPLLGTVAIAIARRIPLAQDEAL